MGGCVAAKKNPQEKAEEKRNPEEKGNPPQTGSQEEEKMSDIELEDSKEDESLQPMPDDEIPSVTRIGCKNDDKYFTSEETEHYKKLYANEQIKKKPVSNIKWQSGNKVLGTGSFGRVLYGFNTETGQIMAVKQVLLSDFKYSNMDIKAKELEQEIEILSLLNHKNIVRYLGTTRDENYFNIFLEYEAGGSIAELLRKYGVFKEPLIKLYTKQILEGLEYLHAHDVVHRDIKGGNVLVDSKGICKLADFGGAKKIYASYQKDQFNSLKGTPYWMAPEVIKQTGYGRKADIWSVGCTIIEMATGRPPWSKYKNPFTAMYYIGHAAKPPHYPPGLSPVACSFLDMILKKDPKERANVCALLKHPFITMQDVKDGTSPAFFIIENHIEEEEKKIKQLREAKEKNESVISHDTIKPEIKQITSGKNQEIPKRKTKNHSSKHIKIPPATNKQ